MANTEIRNALQILRQAEESVTDSLEQSGLTQEARDLLNEALDVLRDVDNLLVKIDLSQGAKDLEEKSGELSKLNNRVKAELAGLKNIADVVDKASTAVDALVKAFGGLGSAGLL